MVEHTTILLKALQLLVCDPHSCQVLESELHSRGWCLVCRIHAGRVYAIADSTSRKPIKQEMTQNTGVITLPVVSADVYYQNLQVTTCMRTGTAST